MAKTKISEYSSTANSNTDIASINIDEGCAPSGINNAIRALMAQIKDLYAGTSGDTWPVTAGGTGSGTASGARTNLGLVIGTDVQAYDADLAAIASSGKGAEIASYGTYGVGFKNRIINGAMVIDQRNSAASPVQANYSVDRWAVTAFTGAKFSLGQSSVAPAGFTNSLVATSLSAYSLLTNDTYGINQPIEGFNVADLGFGTSSAQTITVSFWVRCSLTGNFGGAVVNNAANRSYTFSYTINSANTWEYKTVTISGDTTGTWPKDNSKGLELRFGLGSSGVYTQAAGSWGTANAVQPSGQVSLVGTNGATFYITGVQLEKGSTATSFDYRPYGTEDLLCKRYYQRWSFQTNGDHLGNGQSSGGSQSRRVNWSTMTTMRSTPSLNYSGTITAYIAAGTGTTLSSLGYSGGSTPWRISVDMNTAGSCGTAGDMNFVLFSSGSWLDASSEL